MAVRLIRITALIGVFAVIVSAVLAGRTAGSTGATTRLSRSCLRQLALKAFAPRPLPTELSTPLEASIVSSFAIFRRPALPSDAPPPSGLAGGELRRQLHQSYELAGYYPAYVRELVALPGGGRYFVVPAFALREAQPPAHCLSTSERRELTERQHRRSIEPVFCIIETGARDATSDQGCEPFAQVDEAVRAFGASDFFVGQGTAEPVIELVPDGVSSVRVAYRSVRPAIFPVSGNAFLLTPPPTPNSHLDTELRRLEPRLLDTHHTKAEQRKAILRWNKAYAGTYPTRIEWLNSSDEVVRVLERPRPEGNLATSVGQLDAPIGG
ncbi:MAG TPA: hypothetical protein VMB51_16345 [Solirubrobacteraceae bacterium]|nr:hypothetical protein [Solirubrobacteraceae bacterium]